MSLNIDHLVSVNQSAVDSYLSLNQIIIDSIEQIAALNLSSSRTLIHDQIEHAQSLLSIKSPQEAVSLHSDLVQPGSDRLVAYSRTVYAISAKTQEEITRLIERQQVEWNKSVSSFIDTLSKSAPSGSDVAVAAVKSAVNAANSAFDSVNKASRQVANITEAGLAAASDATVRAVSSANAASRKKAA
jgi:phasin family protein